jgi:hypothetical protein
VLRLGDQGADLDEVVGQNAMSSPDSGPFVLSMRVRSQPYPRLRGADPASASGSPFHRSPECPTPCLGLSDLAGSALARDHDRAHTLWVPNWSSMSCDLGIFVDQPTEPVTTSEAKLGW